MTRYRLFTGKDDEDIDKVAELHLEYYKEIFKDDFIGNYDKVKRVLEYKTDTIFLLYKDDILVGFTEITLNDLYGNIKTYLEVEQMYIKPEFRSKMVIGNMFALTCLVSRANGDIPIAGNTIMTSSNISNNIKAGGTKYSETFVFNPTENLKSRRFYDRAIKLWERNSKNESEI